MRKTSWLLSHVFSDNMNILVVRSGGLGDCLLTLPVLKAIMYAHPGADITILGTGTMREVAELAGYIHLADIDDPQFVSLFTPVGTPLAESLHVFLSVFDTVYVYSAAPEPDMLACRITGAGAGVCYVLDPRLPNGSHDHIVTHLMRISAKIPSFSMIDTAINPPLLGHIRNGSGTGVLIHPGSGGKAKTWPLKRFLDVAAKMDETVRFIIGPAECERGMKERLITCGYPVSINRSIQELADLIASARIFIGNDSGAGHLAGMTGTPAVILYGPTDPINWQPLGERVGTVVSPDGNMTGISVDDVVLAVQSLV